MSHKKKFQDGFRNVTHDMIPHFLHSKRRVYVIIPELFLSRMILQQRCVNNFFKAFRIWLIRVTQCLL